MLFYAVRTAWATLVISALAASAAPSLSVKVSGPDAVTHVKNLLLKVTVANTGDQTLTLINHPYGPLTTSPTEIFTITHESGASPAFRGVLAKYAGVEFVAANGKPDAFTVLTPGESVVVTHDLSKAYDFTKAGEGKYRFEAVSMFHYVDSGKNAIPIKAYSEAHDLTLNGVLSAIEYGSGLRESATYVGCNAAQQSQVNTAITGARAYVTQAIKYVTDHTTASTRFTTWFGAFQSTRRSVVLSNFNSLAQTGTEFTGWTYDCTLAGCDPGDFAWVSPTVYGTVHLCDEFWPAPTKGTNSKAGTLVHEGSHFVATAGTKDFAYGQDACKDLAKTNPNQAIRNADSYEYFAENNPPLQ